MYAPSSLPRKTALVGLMALLASQAEAFWRLPCSSPVVVERSDPIMDPGVVSKHAHTVMGSNAFNFTMDYALTQTATCTTCKVKQDLSSYWVPNLYYHAENGSFVPVKQSGGALIYYLQRQDEKDPEYEKGLLAFPKDFRMIAGNPDNRNASDSLEQRAVSFVCLGVDGPATPTLPERNCPNGLRTQLVFPSCWDGENLDAADHKSHMAYPSRVDSGACPASHPKRFITIFYEVTWNVDDFKDAWPGAGAGRPQPFVFSHGDPTGLGFHGDFLNGWDVPTLQKAVDECTASSGVVEECGAFEFHTDDAMNACRLAPRVAEAVTGPAAAGGLPALPGCNPVQAGPEPAVRGDAERCAAPAPGGGGGNGNGNGDNTTTTTAPDTRLAVGIGAPALPFTDAAPSKRWRYVGCLRDGGAFATRTLDGPARDAPDMTVGGCLDFCAAAGFAYAGLEYRTQCFCGRAPAAGRAQPAGTLGACDMPCAGDAAQICGGYGQESVYQKCEGTGVCQNAELV